MFRARAHEITASQIDASLVILKYHRLNFCRIDKNMQKVREFLKNIPEGYEVPCLMVHSHILRFGGRTCFFCLHTRHPMKGDSGKKEDKTGTRQNGTTVSLIFDGEQS